MKPSTHRLMTGLIYYGIFCLGIFVIGMFAMLGDWLVDGEWGFAAALVGMLIGFGIVFQLFRLVRRKRRDSLFRLSFPGYDGKPVPAGNLLSLSLSSGGQSFATGHDTHMIANGGGALFVVQHLRSSTPEDVTGGKIVPRPGGSEPFAIAHHRLRMIEVIEINDEQIAAAAKDNREYTERLVQEGVSHLLGVKSKTKIIPFAAYLRLVVEGDEGPENLLFAFPTEINDATLRALGVDSNDETNALITSAVRNAIGKGKDALVDEGRDLVNGAIGSGLLDAVDTVVGWEHDIEYWTNIGAAKIGSKDGARGRLWARLVAERLRATSGLQNVVVSGLEE